MRSLVLLAAPWAALLTARWAAVDPASAALETLLGTGWGTAVACITCIGAGVTLASTGSLALLLWYSNGAYAAAGCIAACADAVLI